MAHKKGQGATQNVRDSNPQYLGVKKYGSEEVEPGHILVRQRGTPIHPGIGVGRGKDDTLFAQQSGIVSFTRGKGGRKFVNVISPEEETR